MDDRIGAERIPPHLYALAIIILGTAPLALQGAPLDTPWTPKAVALILTPPLAGALLGLALLPSGRLTGLLTAAAGALLWPLAPGFPLPDASWQAALLVLLAALLAAHPRREAPALSAVATGAGLALAFYRLDPTSILAGLTLAVALYNNIAGHKDQATIGVAVLLATLALYKPTTPLAAAILLLPAATLALSYAANRQATAMWKSITVLAPAATVWQGPAAGAILLASYAALAASEKNTLLGPAVAAAGLLGAWATVGLSSENAPLIVAAVAAGLAGIAYLGDYASMVTGKARQSPRGGLLFILLAVALASGGIYSTPGDCGAPVGEPVINEGPTVNVQVRVEPPGVVATAPPYEGSLEEKLVLYRAFPAVITSPGSVEAITVRDFAGNETLTVEPEGPGFLLLDLEQPVTVWTGVEPGDERLQVTLEVEGLTIPWELLGGAPYNPPHTLLVVHFSAPLVVESPNGVEIQVYEAVLATAELTGGRTRITETAVGVSMDMASLGLLEATITANGTSIPIPRDADEGLVDLFSWIVGLYSSSPDDALAVSALPEILRSQEATTSTVAAAYTYTEAGEGYCAAAPGLEACTPIVVLDGIGACVVEDYAPTTRIPATGGTVDMLAAGLLASADNWLAAYGLALEAGENPGALLWAARYLSVLEPEPAVTGKVYPLLGLGVLAGFLTAAGVLVSWLWSGKESVGGVRSGGLGPNGLGEGEVEVGEAGEGEQGG